MYFPFSAYLFYIKNKNQNKCKIFKIGFYLKKIINFKTLNMKNLFSETIEKSCLKRIY